MARIMSLIEQTCRHCHGNPRLVEEQSWKKNSLWLITIAGDYVTTALLLNLKISKTVCNFNVAEQKAVNINIASLIFSFSTPTETVEIGLLHLKVLDNVWTFSF